MPFLGAIGFTTPWLLFGLLALPILWWLLRAVPPAPIRRRFPAVTLLLGLKDPETTPDKTPWWLLLLRMLVVAAMIVGFAGPVLNPQAPRLATGPLLVLLDGSWASADDWQLRQDKLNGVLGEAGRNARPVALVNLSDPPPNAVALDLQDASVWQERLDGLAPQPWSPDYTKALEWLQGLENRGVQTIWISDGLQRDGRADVANALAELGKLTVIEAETPSLALRPPEFTDGMIELGALRALPGPEQNITLKAFGPDPSGVEQVLAQLQAAFPEGETVATVTFDLPSELRNRIRRFEISGVRSAGATVVSDDALKRRKVALFAGVQAQEGQELVSSLHFLRKALVPGVELIEAPVGDSLRANPDVVILADVAKMTGSETLELTTWVENGGLLVRFAGPKLAASTVSQTGDDPLLPVELRAGGRNVGGAMSWGSPKQLKPFEKGSPFFGLEVPDEVAVTSQVLAQPGPFLAERTIASLQDGTPLVTQETLGEGRVVLVHVTANAEWSNLPLSGLFMQMLERLAISTRNAVPGAEDLIGQVWTPERVMNGFGDLREAPELAGVDGKLLAERQIGPLLPPGTYKNGDRQIAVNVMTAKSILAPSVWSTAVQVQGMQQEEEQSLMAALLVAALGLMMLDILATLALSGRLTGPKEGVVGAFLLIMTLSPQDADAQNDDALALRSANATVLAYVKTGDSRVDAISDAGLFGLSQVLTRRTAIEPEDPIAINLETDELAFYPLIYWPVTQAQPLPSDAAYVKLNTYLRTGGMILFDTRDANIGGFGSGTPNGRQLQKLAASLDIPALEPVPGDHVLTRSFYLLQNFPGRHAGRDVWVEAAPADAKRIEGMPFRNLNDGVTQVVIGGNDWASAWAMNRQGQFMFPVGRGSAGERQREFALRFGVNLTMYVLTGNYKSDQVHVPALLERLGQ